VGSAVFGPYRIAAVLSRSPSATVYRAHDTSHHDRVVALKVFDRSLSADPGFRERFRRDAGLLSALGEPHVVPIHRYGEIDGALYLDMRLVRGPSLADAQRSGSLDPARAAMISQQIAAATESMHRGGLGHRPLQPRDVLLTGSSGRPEFVQLVGLGLGRVAAREPPAVLVQPTPRRRPRRRLLLAVAAVAVVAVVLATVAAVRGALGAGAPGLVATIPSPLSPVADLDVASHDGRPVLVAATVDGSVHAWDLDTGRELWPAISGAAVAVAPTALDGGTVVVARNRDGTIVVRDLATGDPVGSPLGHPQPAHPAAPAWRVATAELDGTPVYVASQPTGAQLPNAFGPAERQLGLQAFALPGGAPAGPLLAEDGQSIGGFSITEIERRPVVVSVVGGSAVHVRDLATGARVGVPTPRQPAAFGAIATAVLDGEPVAVTGGSDNAVRIWDLRTGQQVGQPLVGHTAQVNGLAVVRDGDRTVVASTSGAYSDAVRREVRFWDLAAGTPLGAPLTGHPLCEGIAASSDGSDGEEALLVAVPSAGPITVWDAQRLAQEAT
jgi:outer membrane protein assembly factor BamB